MLLSRKFLSGVTLTCAAAMISAGFLFAEDAPEKKPEPAAEAQPAEPAQPGQPAQPDQNIQHYRAKQIIGSKVNIEGNTAVGTVDDVVFDEHGNVDYLIVAKDDASLVTVPWDAAAFNVETRVATVQITPQRFQAVPTYTVKRYPVFGAPRYRSQVYTYYGVTPGQERRAIRRAGTTEVIIQK
jgi:hypothetical protein